MRERGISFEMCQAALEQGHLLAIVPNNHPRTHQKKLIVLINNYVYVVPYVEDGDKVFFKTAYASHEENKKYLKNYYDKN